MSLRSVTHLGKLGEKHTTLCNNSLVADSTWEVPHPHRINSVQQYFAAFCWQVTGLEAHRPIKSAPL